MEHIKVEYSSGRGKNGRKYAYIRPAGKCSNRSRRIQIEKVAEVISTHFPQVNYYIVDTLIIGAKNEAFALREFYRVCEKSKINQPFEVVFSHSA